MSHLNISKRKLSDISSIAFDHYYQQPDLKKTKENASSSNKTLAISSHNLSPRTPNDSDARESTDSSTPLILMKQTFESLEPHYLANQSKYPLNFFCFPRNTPQTQLHTTDIKLYHIFQAI